MNTGTTRSSHGGVVKRKRTSKRRQTVFLFGRNDEQEIPGGEYSRREEENRMIDLVLTKKRSFGKMGRFNGGECSYYNVQEEYLRRFAIRNAPAALIELAPELVVHILEYLPVNERHLAAIIPLNQRHAHNVRENINIWFPLCTAKPWQMSWSDLEERGYSTASEFRELHTNLIHAIDIARRGDVAQVANIMKEFQDVIGLQYECLERLIIALHCERVRKRAIDAKLASCVIYILQRYSHNTELQSMALHCIVFLARPIGGAEGMVFCRGVHSNGLEAFLYGGIDIVLDAMKNHISSSVVQAVGCWSLVNLALNRQQKIDILTKNGIQCIIRAMQIHPHCLDVQFRALFALINLVIPENVQQQFNQNDPHNTNTNNTFLPQDTISHDILDHVLIAMDRFGDSDKLIRCGCLVLHNLSLRPTNIPILQANNTSKPLLRAARTHNDHDVQRSAISTLRRLGISHA